MAVPFTAYPRRVVPLPDGHSALVLIHRDIKNEFNYWSNWDLRWEFELLARLIRRNRLWRVELYVGIDSDPGGVPEVVPSVVWVLRDRVAAAAFAETLASHLHQSGMSRDLPQPTETSAP